MKQAHAFFVIILSVAFIMTGFMISVNPPEVYRITQKSESLNSGFLFKSYIENNYETENSRSGIADPTDSEGTGFNFREYETGRVNLNDVAVYNGMISAISVSPTVVMYDYNHDGIVDVKKTVLFFNIG